MAGQIQVMEPSSDAPHSQRTPTAQAEPIAQVVPIATPTNAEVPPLPPNGKGKLVPTAYIVEAPRKALAEMVIIDKLHFRFVEGYEFQRYLTILQPKLRIRNILSRQTVARDVIVIYAVEREKLREALKGHFIDDDWNLYKRILNFCQVEDHKGETIGRNIEMYLREWGINGIFTLTVDNASSNGATNKFLQTITKDWEGIFGT
ncbi:hypothetical protein SO802_017750 [Lithocarpus litseifolius]|uniref:Uncharacterized protein n=1 Tax=Lithocarpus litseifolius TaxID=425828 RepID=A0AAW2CL82_9ROSI